MAATRTEPPASRRVLSGLRQDTAGGRIATLLAGAALLALFAWIWVGYRWLAWPQPGFVDHVLRYDGQLSNDWHTSLPPVHWAMTHLYGLVPFGALEPVVAISWVLLLVLMGGAFILTAEALGAGRATAVAAGLIAMATGFAGVGVSGTVLNVFYPTAVSFAFVLAAVAALLGRRPVLAAGLLGVATLTHPNQGALATLACALPLVVLLGRDLRRWALAGVAYGVFALPSVINAALGQTSGSTLDDAYRYDLIAIIRQPHHLRWDAFPVSEYLQTGLWTVVLAVTVAVVLRGTVRRLTLLLTGSILVVLAAGAIAAAVKWPLLVVMLQTSRLSALLVALGVAAGAALMQRVAGRWAPAALLGAFVLAFVAQRVWYNRVGPELFAGQTLWITVSAAAAGAVLLAAGLAAWLRARDRPVAWAGWAAAALAVVAFVAVTLQRDTRIGTPPPAETLYADVAEHAREASAPGTLVLAPPDVDGFRDLSRRPVVAEWGTIRYAEGDGEWLQRMRTLTGGAPVFDVAPYGEDVPARTAAIGAAYDAATARPTAACRYGAKLVVTRTRVPQPSWAQPIYENALYRLSRVRPGACA